MYPDCLLFARSLSFCVPQIEEISTNIAHISFLDAQQYIYQFVQYKTRICAICAYRDDVDDDYDDDENNNNCVRQVEN